MDRLRMSFGHTVPWDDERVLERYELLYEAGLLAEAARDGRTAAKDWAGAAAIWAPDDVRSPPDFGDRDKPSSR